MRTARKTALSLLVLPVLALLPAACDSAKPERDPGDMAGEVLPGTISDDMIHLDQLRSQGESLKPQDAATEGAGRPAGTGSAAADPGEADAPDAPTEAPADAADEG